MDTSKEKEKRKKRRKKKKRKIMLDFKRRVFLEYFPFFGKDRELNLFNVLASLTYE